MLVLPILLVLLPMLLLVGYLQFRWSHRRILSAASKLRSPPALPLIGNALYFLGDITSVTKNIVRFTTQFKGLFCLWVGPVPVFVVSDPNDVQIILNNSNTLEKDDTYNFLKPFMGNGLLTAPVHHWKKQRRMLNPLLHPSNVEKFLPEFNAVGAELADHLGQPTGVVDPRDGVFNIATDAIMRTLMGRHPLSKEAKQDIFDLLHNVGRMFTYRLFKVWLHVDWLFHFLYKKEMNDANEKLSALIKVFEEHWSDAGEKIKVKDVEAQEISEGTAPKSMVDIAIENVKDGGQKEDWFNEITTMIVGATDTIVAAISFLLLSLANHPEIQQKVHAEIEEVVGSSDRDVTLDDLHRMPYLNQAFMETMRLHGVFPCILRKVTKDIKLSSSTLPTGSRVMLTLHAMGWDPDTFPEPHKFNPERFAPEALHEHKRHNYAFLPFSAGPRNCIGKTYALIMMKTVAVHVLRRFRVSTTVRLEDIQYELKVVMHSRTPLMLRFETNS